MSSTLQSGVKLPAYPTREQAVVLSRWIGSQMFIFNAKVGEDHLFAAQRRLELRSNPDSPITTPVDNTYAQFKDDELSPFLSEVPSQVLRQGVCRWRAAKQRQLAGLAKAPRKRNRRNFNTVQLDSDMFCFKEQGGAEQGGAELALYLGGEGKYSLGRLRFKAHRSFGLPKMLTITREGYRWFVSFSYPHESPLFLREPHELAYELNLLSDKYLSAATVGLDRNVKDNAFASSTGVTYLPEKKVMERIERKRVARVRRQRAYARKQKGSNNSVRARLKVAQTSQYEKNVWRDFAHQASHAIVSSADVLVIGIEDLKLVNMARAPKPKKDENTGRWLRNGASAKAGLNDLLRSRALGLTVQCIKYKAQRVNKLVISVPPRHTSQECSRCGHTHPDNRHDQRFVCTKCDFKTHADLNAAAVIKGRTVEALRNGMFRDLLESEFALPFDVSKKKGWAAPDCLWSSRKPLPSGFRLGAQGRRSRNHYLAREGIWRKDIVLNRR